MWFTSGTTVGWGLLSQGNRTSSSAANEDHWTPAEPFILNSPLLSKSPLYQSVPVCAHVAYRVSRCGRGAESERESG